MLRTLLFFVIIFFAGSWAIAQDNDTDSDPQSRDTPQRYNFLGKKLDPTSDEAQSENVDKNYFTIEEWAQKFIREKKEIEKRRLSRAFLVIAQNYDSPIQSTNPYGYSITFSTGVNHDSERDYLRESVALLIRSNDQLAQSTAISVIQTYFVSKFNEELLNFLNSKSLQVRSAAYGAIATTDIPELELIEIYAKALNNPKESQGIRMQAVNYLSQKLLAGDQTIVSILEDALKPNRRDRAVVSAIGITLRKYYNHPDFDPYRR